MQMQVFQAAVIAYKLTWSKNEEGNILLFLCQAGVLQPLNKSSSQWAQCENPWWSKLCSPVKSYTQTAFPEEILAQELL